MTDKNKKSPKSSSATSASKTAGKKIGKYKNAVLLAKGGMGAIYKADHPTLDQPVVLKMLTLTGNDQFTQRFQREATIMMGFQHENIVNYFDHFKTTRSYCMVMEYVDGCSLAQLLERHRYLDDAEALLILRDTLRALSYAHSKGVIHRDIKPANIMISSDGRVKLTDFGIAHDQGVDADGLTKEGMTLGTPSYMAPEQFQDAGAVDIRADIYSAGVLLYECLCGRKPFSGSSLPEMLERIRKGRYERLGKARPESTQLTRRLVARAVRPKARRRFKNAEHMLKRLDRSVTGRNEEALRLSLAGLVAGKEKKKRTSGTSRRKILALSGIFLAGLAGAALVLGIWWLGCLYGKMPGFLLPDWVGALSVEVVLGEGAVRPPRVYVDLFGSEDGSPVLLESGIAGRAPIAFARRSEVQKVSDSIIIPPKPVKPGLYQVVVRIGDDAHVIDLRVQSMKDRYRGMAGSGYPVAVLSLNWEPDFSPATVVWAITRGDDGREITTAGLPTIVDGEGTAYAPGDGSVLLPSGRTYEFSFSAPGFEDRVLRVDLEPGSPEYDLSALMMPKAVAVTMSSSLPFRRPDISGEKTYRSGEAAGGFHRLPMLSNDEKTIMLAPGRYDFGCGRGDKRAIIGLDLEAGDTLNLVLEKNSEGVLEWRNSNE